MNTADQMLTKRERMVRDQIAARGVTDPKVLDAMLKVERHLFMPKELWLAAYADGPFPIGHGQTISQPYIVAYMTEALRLKAEDRVLEVGTGCGYQAAVLAEIVKKVYTIEIIKPLAESARQRLEGLGYNNIEVKPLSGYDGWPSEAPFDAIMVTAAPVEIPEELVRQLKIGGRMIVPVGSFFQELQLVVKNPSGVEVRHLIPVRFVPMVNP